MYNAGSCISRTLRSVISQDLTDYEWLICDDGSTDGCADVIKEYISDSGDERIRILHQGNSGVSAARNTCLKAACGKYIMFLDADDELMPHAFSTLYEDMEATGADLIIYSWNTCDSSGTFKHEFGDDELNACCENLYYAVMAEDTCCGGGYPWNKIWRRDSIAAANGSLIEFDTNLHHFEDKLWVLMNLDRISHTTENGLYNFAFETEPLYKYYIHEDSLSHGNVLHLLDIASDGVQATADYVCKAHTTLKGAAREWQRRKINSFLKILEQDD